MELEKLARQIETANDKLEALTNQRDQAIRDALRDGTAGATELARIFNLGRARIYQIRDGRR